MDTHQVLAWKQGFERARAFTCDQVRQGTGDPQRSIGLALSLIEFCRKQKVWPDASEDIVRARDVEEVRKRWSRLKRRGDVRNA